MRRHGSPEELEAVRLRAFDLGEQGMASDVIAIALDRSVRSGQLWRKTGREEGRDALKAKPHPGAESKLIRRYAQQQGSLFLEYLPGFAPELNPVESMWSHGKCHRLANYCPSEVDELHDTAQTVFAEYRTNQRLLHAFVRHAGLPMLFGKRIYQSRPQ